MVRFVLYIAKRILLYVAMIFVATSLTYFLASAFMSPRSNYESRTPRPPQESIEKSLNDANLNDKTPILERYAIWLTRVTTRFDWGLTPTGASVFMVIPTVVVAILVVFFAIEINMATGYRIFYVTGLSSYDGENVLLALVDFLQHIFLPTVVLTIISAVGYHLTQRTYLLDEMHADYVRTARAKGLTRKQAIRRHALRASLIPTAVSVAFSIAGIFTGAVMTEKIFAIHGLGEYFVNCINGNNVHGAVAVAAFSGACTLVGALLADLFAAAIDPRIKMMG